jgi:DNA-binding MarR family transcriptional regulator
MNTASAKNLAEELGKRHAFSSLRQEAFLNLVRTHSDLTTRFSKLYKQHGLTAPKYNALRILRGEDRPMQVYQIAERMVTPQTDVTRLVDRLEVAGFVKRERCGDDRRVVWVKLTPKGKTVLRELDVPVEKMHESQFAGFSQKELRQLNQLLFRARTR